MQSCLALLFLLSLLATGYSAGQCFVNNPPVERNPFPNRTYLTYGESTVLRMKDYFTGVNLTFAYTTSDSTQGPTNINKIKKNDGNFEDIIKQIFGDSSTTVVDIYWDDINVTSLNQKWGNESNVVILVKVKTDYVVISGSINNLHSYSEGETVGYNRINLIPPSKSEDGGESEQIQDFECSQIARVGMLKYYVDCSARKKDKTLIHYFNYVEMAAFPPSTSTVTALEARLKMDLKQFYGKRGIASAVSGNSVFLVFFYNKKEHETKAAIETYDVTNPGTLKLVSSYTSEKKVFEMITNIQSLVVSGNFLYISQSEDFTIFRDWTTTKITYVKNYHFDQIDFKHSSLRSIPTVTGNKETVVAVGSVNKANLFALIFVNQAYQGFYTIPLPSAQEKSQPLQFQIFGLSMGEDFFALSYSVAEEGRGTLPCYYFAIVDVTSSQANECHTLWVSSSTEYVRYVKMNPAANTDTLYIIRANNTFTNLGIFSPTIPLYGQTKTTQLTLTIENYKKFQLDIIVLPRGEKQISVNVDNNAALYKNIIQRGSQAILFLNSSIFGPNLEYSLIPTQNQPLKFNLFTMQSISSNFKGDGGEFLAARRRKVGPFEDQNFLLVENVQEGGVKFHIARPEVPSNTNISSLRFGNSEPKSFKVLDYFFAGGFDIMLVDEGNQALVFCKLDLHFRDTEKNKCSQTENYVISTMKKKEMKGIFFMERTNGDITVMGINEGIVYIEVLSGANPLKVKSQFKVSASLFNKGSAFFPAKIQLHPEYLDTAFVTTTSGTATYIVDYSQSFHAKEEETTITYVVVFAQHESTSESEVIVQPFDKNLFYIFPKLNVIEHWDLSVRKAPYFKRNLDLYSYDIGLLLNNTVIKKGNAFSSTTDTLYLIAEETETSELVVLVLKPNNAHSYLVKVIPLRVDKKSSQNIAIDVTGTHTSTFGNLYGDILVISIGGQYTFVEVYPIPYVSFPIRLNERLGESSPNLLNQRYSFNLKANNQWNNINSSLILSLFEDEKSLQVKGKSIKKRIEENVTNVTFGLSELFTGTIYNLSLIGATSGDIEMDSFIISSESPDTFELPSVTAVILGEKNTYYLGQKIVIYSNDGSKKPIYVPLVETTDCSNLLIDPTETYGVAVCIKDKQEGLVPFYINKISDASFFPFPYLKDIYFDGKNSLAFVLIQAKGQKNSSVIAYALESTPNLRNPLITMQDWFFSKTNLQLDKFDVFYYHFAKVHLLFALDSSYGLRVIYFMASSRVADLVASFSFAELYQSFPVSANTLKFYDISITGDKCENEEQCSVKVLLVAENFHSLHLQFEITKQALTISKPAITALLVSSDFQVTNYQHTAKSVILLARNKTAYRPSIDMLAFNTSESSPTLSSIDPKDQTNYKIPIWVQPLHPDMYQYVKDTHSLTYPTIFFDESGSDETIIFPNLQSKTMQYKHLKNKISLRWNSTVMIDQILFSISNHYQQIEFPVSLIKPSDEIERFPYLRWILGLVGILLLFCFCSSLYHKSRNKKIRYARRKQKDPLRDLLLL